MPGLGPKGSPTVHTDTNCLLGVKTCSGGAIGSPKRRRSKTIATAIIATGFSIVAISVHPVKVEEAGGGESPVTWAIAFPLVIAGAVMGRLR